jgi:hypothetical protein
MPVRQALFERDSERWMQVEWAEQLTRPFETSVHVLVKNGKGVLAQVASAISSAEADIVHLDMDPNRPRRMPNCACWSACATACTWPTCCARCAARRWCSGCRATGLGDQLGGGAG